MEEKKQQSSSAIDWSQVSDLGDLRREILRLESENSRLIQENAKLKEIPLAKRNRLPDTRRAITHKFDIASHEGFVTVGLYEDGTPGEFFITMAKEGSTIGGLMDTIGTLVSLAFQYGIPLEVLVKKFAGVRFEPSGFTKNPDIPNAKSVTDYLFRWLGMQFIPGYREGYLSDVQRLFSFAESTSAPSSPSPVPMIASGREDDPVQEELKKLLSQDSPACGKCGAIMARDGACYKCFNCGATIGCS